jgi:hypothetical protein
MPKPKVTRTYGPIHFEDLDPHRFEDLVRELIYDYKDWQSIEATGRSGSDEGFDIRAYEKAATTSHAENEDDGEVEEVHPMEGNLWMIQGKREKEISPKRVQAIIAEINEKEPPYGYILAASANFSKKSYDVFREGLRKKGVMEFYLWGKAELEDMLHLPKNDRILFTFLGISLVSRRRSRVTEVRSIVGIKNKLYRAVGEGGNLHQSVLIRDLKDTHYPYKKEYKDFETMPRWKEYIAFAHHPLGLLVHSHKYYAYIDTEKKEWDFTDEAELLHRQVERDDRRKSGAEKQELVEGVWDFFPRINQGHFIIDGLVKYAEIAVVDDKGDVLYNFPHLYVDFTGEKGSFTGWFNTLEIGDREIQLTEDYKRTKVFPDKLQKMKFGTIYKDKSVTFDSETLNLFKKYGQINALYESDGRYSFLKPRDIIPVADVAEESFIQITYMVKAKIKDYMGDSLMIRRNIEQQLGRKFDDNEEINIYEFKRIYKWHFEKDRQ